MIVQASAELQGEIVSTVIGIDLGRAAEMLRVIAVARGLVNQKLLLQNGFCGSLFRRHEGRQRL